MLHASIVNGLVDVFLYSSYIYRLSSANTAHCYQPTNAFSIFNFPIARNEVCTDLSHYYFTPTQTYKIRQVAARRFDILATSKCYRVKHSNNQWSRKIGKNNIMNAHTRTQTRHQKSPRLFYVWMMMFSASAMLSDQCESGRVFRKIQKNCCKMLSNLFGNIEKFLFYGIIKS